MRRLDDIADQFLALNGQRADVGARTVRFIEALGRSPVWPADDLAELRRLIKSGLDRRSTVIDMLAAPSSGALQNLS